jgi:adenosylcobinamide-GDP ribazoletransferase
LAGLLAAFQFLTLLPVKRNFTAEQVARATTYFPIVGIIIGLITAGLNFVLGMILPSPVVNVLIVAALAILSGALHLDGLADTLDGLAGHRTSEERLKIMRDSRIGGFGAIGVALFLLIEYVVLNNVPAEYKLYSLVLAPILSRWAMVNSIFVYPYARPTGLGRAFKDAVNWRQYAIATVVSLLVSIVLFRISGLVIMVGVWIVISAVSWYFQRQLKGLTGDTYGAINEISVITVFIIVIMLAFKHWWIG